MSTDKTRQPPLWHRFAVRPDDACGMISMSRARLYRLLQSGEIPSFTSGRMRLIPVEALRTWTEERSGTEDQVTGGRK
jgi:excisionase family DNA binding protein